MSNGENESIKFTNEVDDEEIEVGLKLIEEDNFLRNDGFARRVVEAGGVLEDGSKIDLIDFLSARRAHLTLGHYEKVNPALVAFVVSSERPHFEIKD